MGVINVNGGFETILEREVLVYGYSIDRTDKNIPLIYVTTYHKFFTQKVFMLLCNVNAARDRGVDCTIKIWLWHTMLLDNEQPSREPIHSSEHFSEQCLLTIFILYFKSIYNLTFISTINNFSLSTCTSFVHKIHIFIGLFT